MNKANLDKTSTDTTTTDKTSTDKTTMRKILLLNGPNLDMLGIREPGVYGSKTLDDLVKLVKDYGVSRGVCIDAFQSNSEGALVDVIHDTRLNYDGIIYNPGAHTHYSYALRDALGGIDVPCVEVHISDVENREAFRQISVIAPVCVAQIKGRGFQGYLDALDVLCEGSYERLGENYKDFPCQDGLVIRPFDISREGDQLTPDQLDRLSAMVAWRPDTSQLRLAQLREEFKKGSLDAFSVRDTANITWLCAFDKVFDDEAAHALFVSAVADQAILHTDSRYSEAARAAALREGSVKVCDERQTHAAFIKRAWDEAFCAPYANMQQETGDAALGIEDSIALREFRQLQDAFSHEDARLIETDELICKLRAVKDEVEIARMRAAQRITDAAFAHIVAFMRPGMTEREVQIELESFMLRHGADDLAFSSIVACGANGASPHAIPGQTKLEAGQCVVLDFGAKAAGYCSDMTRTVFLGEPTQKMRDAYAAIRSANEQVEASLRPGVTGCEMHELAERVLADAGFANKMGHGLGHGVGLEIHELPVLSPRNKAALVAGNVVTVEPGIYVPGEFGMRLEDFGVVTEDGFEVFTASTHDMVIL